MGGFHCCNPNIYHVNDARNFLDSYWVSSWKIADNRRILR